MTPSPSRDDANSRRRLRRITTLAGSTLALVTTIAACGSNGSASGTSGATSSAQGNLVLGATGPLSGAQQDLGSAFDGMKAYFAQINKQGGIDGHKITFIVRDDQFNPAETPQQVRQLVTGDKVNLLCGNLGSDQLASVASYLTKEKVPSVALSGANAYATAGSTIFEQLPPYGPLGAQVAQHVVAVLKFTKVAIAYSPDGIGEPFRDGATSELAKLGLKPVATVAFNPANSDQSTVAAQLKASGAQVVLINHITPIVALISKAAAQIGYHPQWASTFALDATNMGQASGGTLNGVYMSTPFILGDSSEASGYRQAIKGYSASLDPNAPIVMEGWTTADACVALLRQAVTAAHGNVPTRAQIIATAEHFTLNDTYVHGLTWTGSYHAGESQAQIIQFKNNTFTTIAPFAAMPGV